MMFFKISGLIAGILGAIGGVIMWSIAIYHHAPYDERGYWMVLSFFMLWLSDRSIKELEA